MSWTEIRPYFENLLDAADHSQWSDGFASDNIPSNLLDRAYHIAIGPLVGISQNQQDQETQTTVTVRTFYKGYNDPKTAIDTAIEQTQLIMQSCVKPSNRVATGGIKNVIFSEANIDPIDGSNDNAVVVTANYTVRVILAV